MKVGILTWYDVLNYGSVFQAYALQKAVEELGVEAEILLNDRAKVDYFGNKLKDKSLRGLLSWLRNQTPNRVNYRHTTKIKYNNFVDFKANYLNINNSTFDNDDDCVLIGSDQIFDINGVYYPWQFGKGIECKRISVYAPSFGETTMESLKASSHYDEIKDSILKLSGLNARDKNTKNILDNITGQNVNYTLDPVLLYTFEKERRQWNERLIDEDYCVIYTWGGTTTTYDFAEKCMQFAKHNNLKLVSVGEIRKWCDYQFPSASPIEFFELFMHSSMVLTNMFHGTCFSILFNKPFYSFVMPHNENKLRGLLELLKLDSQIVKKIDDLKMDIPVIDYDNCTNEHIYSLRQNSISQLKSSIF